MKMQVIVHLALTNYQCTNMQLENAKITRKFLTKCLQIDLVINVISVISTNNKLVLILFFLIMTHQFSQFLMMTVSVWLSRGVHGSG